MHAPVPDPGQVSIQLRRSPGTARQIAEMLAKVNTIIGDVEVVVIGRRATLGYNDTGLAFDVDQSEDTIRAEDLVSEVVKACKEHAVEHGDAWYQATFLSAEREVSTGKNKPKSKMRATLAMCAFPIGEADDGVSPRTAAKAQIESEAAIAIRTISDFTQGTLTKLGEQVVAITGAAAQLMSSQVEVVRQVAQQQKGYVTQGETLVELVKLNHAHALAMAEAEADEKHATEMIDFAKKFGMEWAKANLFTKASTKARADGKPGYTPDPNKPDNVNILADVLHNLTDDQKAKLIDLVGQDVMDLWTAAAQASTDDEFKAIMLRMRDLWQGKNEDEMRHIATNLGMILGPESAMKLYTVFSEVGVAE